jgi:hypothetical protein
MQRLPMWRRAKTPSPIGRAKKYDEAKGIWQDRVNDDWRFYFAIIDDIYRILKVIRHPK